MHMDKAHHGAAERPEPPEQTQAQQKQQSQQEPEHPGPIWLQKTHNTTLFDLIL